jgi:hypothetical protein
MFLYTNQLLLSTICLSVNKFWDNFINTVRKVLSVDLRFCRFGRSDGYGRNSWTNMAPSSWMLLSCRWRAESLNCSLFHTCSIGLSQVSELACPCAQYTPSLGSPGPRQALSNELINLTWLSKMSSMYRWLANASLLAQPGWFVYPS